ncbi:MAG: putative Fe-S cluster assembly protein SufT, partial [Candidatus Marinimicrobia bacterium]|nr:putative Fe-S cluster assembly protein SufT [Candidatus Neomarinimicrobiota bacterium]
MKKNENVILTRDVRAMLVPSGDRITLKKGQQVTITQALGGSYTVLILGNMARIDGADADVLGMQADKPEIPTDDKPTEGPDLEAQVWDQLRACY